MPIELRKVSVHNLKGVDLDLPYGRLIVFCGRSGSGKSSLAMDTLYAEGQRRYIESFSAQTRQFLEKLEKPDAERIDGIPAAIAVASKASYRTSRSTVGTAADAIEYLRLLFAKIGDVHCPCCGREVHTDTPQSILRRIDERFGKTERKIQVAFAPPLETGKDEFETIWKERGFVRGIVLGTSFRLGEGGVPANLYEKAGTIALRNHGTEKKTQRQSGFFDEEDLDDGSPDYFTENGDASEDEADLKTVSSFFSVEHNSKPDGRRNTPDMPPLLIVVDRLTLGVSDESRLVDSLETAMSYGDGTCHILVRPDTKPDGKPDGPDECHTFSRRFACEDCGIEFPTLEPKLFSFNSPLGACPTCEGFGSLAMYDIDLVVPDRTKTIRGGAVLPWTTPAYRPRLDEFLEKAEKHGVPVDVPFDRLSDEQVRRLLDGETGLSGFFRRLERQKYKMHVRVFLSRWRSYRPCPDCGGARLRPEALAVRIGGENIATLSDRKIDTLLAFLRSIELTASQRRIAKTALEQLCSRLEFLEEVRLAYLPLSRSMQTLSGGEQRRIGLTSALGSSLVDMLYVLDEPSVGLHPADTDRLFDTVRKLRDRGNTVVVVEHEDTFLRQADQVVEIGPGAGEAGGNVVFQGTPAEMIDSPQSLTGTYLSGKRGGGFSSKRRLPENGVIEIAGCRGNNLRNVNVAFPLGMLCIVTGVSGAGKSTLVGDTLYPALCRHFNKENPPPGLPFDRLIAGDLIEDVVLVDQGSIGRSPRSNPVTYLKIFDEIRNVFAATVDAKARHFTAGKFSFNVEGGRCEHCKGDGFIAVDLRFMADLFVRCPQCRGKRYRPEILEVLYRGRNIAEVLDMTAREAFAFFRGQSKVQRKLKRLIDVGLDYVRLGQPANTLSGGESQRLKLAAYLAQIKKERTLFLLDEPTTGLHFADVVQLLDCFDALIETGHSLVVVEHNLQLIRAADHLIDLGPGAADRGGRIVAQGPPEEVAAVAESVTGRFLRPEKTPIRDRRQN